MNTNTNTKTNTKTRIILGILAGARSISVRTDAKTGKKTIRREILSNWHCEVYFINDAGETVKHCPLAHFARSIDVPTGTRDSMVVWAMEFAKEMNFGVKPYIVRDYLDARKNVLGRMEKRLSRLEKTVENGRDAFMSRAQDNAASAWDNIPDAISALKIDIAVYSKENV